MKEMQEELKGAMAELMAMLDEFRTELAEFGSELRYFRRNLAIPFVKEEDVRSQKTLSQS